MTINRWRATPILRSLRRSWRKLRASWRDTILLLGEFRQPLLFFILAVTISGWLFYVLSEDPDLQLAEAIYTTLSLTFFQSFGEFPTAWYLQVFFYVMPLIGIVLLAQGLTDFGILLFNRRSRGKEWEMAVASTYSNHVVLVGLGHLGFRVVKKLYEMDEDVVVIERSPDPDLIHNVREIGVPVMEDDGTRESVLIGAGVPKAHAIILCTQNDSLNLRMALKARSLNSKIEVIIRIFDDDFASSLQTQFGFHAMSATGMAAPLFAAIAAHVDVTPPISIDGQPHILANLHIPAKSHLIGMTVNKIEEGFQVSVVLLCKNGERIFHPAGDEAIEPGQLMAIFGEPEQINRIIHENR